MRETNLSEGYKRIYAEDLALALEFEWNYQETEDYDLYEALEANGYEWNGQAWKPIDVAPPKPKAQKPRRQRLSAQEQLAQWNAGTAIKSNQAIKVKEL